MRLEKKTVASRIYAEKVYAKNGRICETSVYVTKKWSKM